VLPETSLIALLYGGRYQFPKFKSIIQAIYSPACGSKTKGFFHLLNKWLTPDNNALGLLIYFNTAFFAGFFNRAD